MAVHEQKLNVSPHRPLCVKARNQVQAREAVTYGINALGQRYSKTAGATTTVYLYDDAGHLIAETGDAGTTYTEYVWLNGTPVAVIEPGSPNLYYIHSDHLDTPRLIEDQSQQVVWRWDNEEPFGGNAPNENPSALGNFTFNLRFPGQYFDAETNNHYNYFRDYSPGIGRYVQSDPIGLAGGMATYAYVKNNPISFTDTSGLITECELFALQLIINRYGAGPKIGAGDIITDPTMSGTAGQNKLGGPIVLNTNPKDPQGYSGSVTAKGQSAAAINTGLHENAHQGQNPFIHQFDAWMEELTGGNISQAQSSAEALMFKYPQMLQQFNQLVEDCRKCKSVDPEVK
ncbi:MAG TPA: RHS repeat-associated core domain-containing protein [Burkholderiales bacterium]|nr:RHS repeat-associated core domain-containing protein [Burkholderiales bacterium]